MEKNKEGLRNLEREKQRPRERKRKKKSSYIKIDKRDRCRYCKKPIEKLYRRKNEKGKGIRRTDKENKRGREGRIE